MQTPQPISAIRFAPGVFRAFDKLRSGVCLAAICLAAGLATVDATPLPEGPAGEPPCRLGIVQFTPPAGWQWADDAGRNAKVFVSPDSTSGRTVAIVVLLTPPLGESFDFSARFAKAVESAADGQPITEHGQTVAGKSRQGCDTLEQTFAFQNAAGQTVRARLAAARVGDRLAAFCYVASGDDLYGKHDADMVNLLSSVRFDEVPATAPSTRSGQPPAAGSGQAPTTARSNERAANPAINAALQSIEQEKAELRKRLAELESKERQLTTPLPTEPGSTTATFPGDPSAGRPTTGPAAGAGSIDVSDRSRGGAWVRGRFPKRTRFLLMLTPLPPADAATRTVSCDVGRLPETVQFTGFAPGKYRLAARAITPDEKSWPLKLTTRNTPGVMDWSDALEIDLTKAVSIGVTDAPK